MKVAVVGTGHWGKNHARNLAQLRDEGIIAEVVVCDLDEARARAVAEPLHAPHVTDFDLVLADEAIKAVILATPTPSHHPLALQALRAGKDVLVEKPLAETTKQAQELLEVAQSGDRIVMPGHLFRYHPLVQDLKQKLGEGRLGEIQYLNVVRKYHKPPRPDMGVIAALGVHDLDLACHLLSQQTPASLCCTTHEHHRPGSEEIAFIHMNFEGGAHAHALESWLSPDAEDQERSMVLVGSGATARIDFDVHDQYTITDAQTVELDGALVVERGSVETVRVEKQEPLRQELMDFLSCVANRTTPLADAGCGVTAVQLVEACQQSAVNGHTVSL